MYGNSLDNSVDSKQSPSMENISKTAQRGKTNGNNNSMDNQDFKNGSNPLGKGHTASLLPSSGSSRKSAMIRDRHQSSSQGRDSTFLVDSEGVLYTQYIENAYQLAYSNNVVSEVVVNDKEKKDKKKQNNNSGETVTETKKCMI